MRATIFAVLPLVVLAACQGSAARRPAAARAPESLREPFTSYFELEVGGALGGYLVAYDPIPEHHRGLRRQLPTGSYRIQNASFVDVGFVTPQGDVRRHGGAGSVSLGHHQSGDLESGLSEFFGAPTRIRPLTLGGRADVN